MDKRDCVALALEMANITGEDLVAACDTTYLTPAKMIEPQINCDRKDFTKIGQVEITDEIDCSQNLGSMQSIKSGIDQIRLALVVPTSIDSTKAYPNCTDFSTAIKMEVDVSTSDKSEIQSNNCSDLDTSSKSILCQHEEPLIGQSIMQNHKYASATIPDPITTENVEPKKRKLTPEQKERHNNYNKKLRSTKTQKLAAYDALQIKHQKDIQAKDLEIQTWQKKYEDEKAQKLNLRECFDEFLAQAEERGLTFQVHLTETYQIPME